MATKKVPPKPVARVKASSKKADPTSRSSMMLASRTEENLSHKQRDRADRFVLQYMRDYNATQAFVRLQVEEGKEFEEIDLNYASNAGYQMTRWPYVAQKIREAIEQAEEKNIVSRAEVLHGLKREAMYSGVGASHSARVGGWGKLAQILGMDSKQVERGLAMRGGVMIVPAVEDTKSWEERAAAAQAALKDEVRK